MGKLYDNPLGPYGHITVTDPEPKLPKPPAPGEGRVIKVNFEHVYSTATQNQWNRCQVCPRTICKADPHIMAFVYLEGQSKSAGGSCKYIHFCSRECWYDWASSD